MNSNTLNTSIQQQQQHAGRGKTKTIESTLLLLLLLLAKEACIYRRKLSSPKDVNRANWIFLCFFPIFLLLFLGDSFFRCAVYWCIWCVLCSDCSIDNADTQTVHATASLLLSLTPAMYWALNERTERIFLNSLARMQCVCTQAHCIDDLNGTSSVYHVCYHQSVDCCLLAMMVTVWRHCYWNHYLKKRYGQESVQINLKRLSMPILRVIVKSRYFTFCVVIG